MTGRAVLWLCFVAQVLVVPTEAGIIIFPGQLDHAEGDSCPTNSGSAGICSRACEHSPGRGDPRKCGIKDSKFLVCCETPIVTTVHVINPNGTGPLAVTDISPPVLPFECGKNTEVLLDRFGFLDDTGGVLRPEAVPDPNVLVEEAPAARPTAARLSKRSPFDPRPTRTRRPPLEPPRPAIGAKDVIRNAWPWMALIGERDALGIKWFCGGVLINEQWVLTARHCFFNNKADVVRLGEHNYNTEEDGAEHEDFGVAETVPYPDYNHPEAYHDLALLRLATKVALKRHIKPVCLAWGREIKTNLIDKKATLTGWGDTQFGGSPSSILQQVDVTVFRPDLCDQSYSNLPHYPLAWPRGIGEETLCAGDLNGGRDACQGDSGGPLVSEDVGGHFVLAGIVSRGYGCGHKDYPGLYANLRHPPYLAWIKKVAFSTP